VKLPSYTINGTRGHHFTPNMPQGMSIHVCGQKHTPFMSNQACIRPSKGSCAGESDFVPARSMAISSKKLAASTGPVGWLKPSSCHPQDITYKAWGGRATRQRPLLCVVPLQTQPHGRRPGVEKQLHPPLTLLRTGRHKEGERHGGIAGACPARPARRRYRL
jgi:hypothetical protein